MTAALPTIAADLVVGASVLQWMANVYVLVPAAPMLVCGTPGDRYGRRQLLLIGLGLFARAAHAHWTEKPVGALQPAAEATG